MSKHDRPPFFPLYPADFVSDGDVEAMSTLEIGAYFLLVCKAWAENPPASIPADDRILARWTRLSDKEWRDCKGAVLRAWKLKKDKRYHQKRLREEYDKFLNARKNKSISGKKGAKNRWRKTNMRLNGKPAGRLPEKMMTHPS